MIDKRRLTNALKLTTGACVLYFSFLIIAGFFLKFIMSLPIWLGLMILFFVVLFIIVVLLYNFDL